MDGNVLTAMYLTLLAGLATGIGGVISLFTKRTNKRFLSSSLGFSAGVMIYIAFMEMMPKSQSYLISSYGSTKGIWYSTAAFFCGMLFIMLIDNLIPSPESDLTAIKAGKHDSKLNRMGVLMALAIGIHNFPEGLATFTSTLDNVQLGGAIAIAIAIHNIPEGVVTAVPIFYSTGSRMKGFLVSILSGITEPIGAIIGYLCLRPFLGNTMYGIIFAVISGIMIYIAAEELIPMAREYDKGNTMILGCICGMIVMAVSLMLFI